MEKTQYISELYFKEAMTLTEISKLVDTSVSYVSKVLRKDERYEIEKEKRKQENLAERRKQQKELIYNNRKNNIDLEYNNMKKQHAKDSMELSKSAILGKNTLRKWCSSAYKYNAEKKRYEFDTNTLLKPVDFPLYIKQ